MLNRKSLCVLVFSLLTLLALSLPTAAQGGFERSNDGDEFGPVMRAYLGYLANEQEVVDDRVSRREISPAYYRRNSNRIRALRLMAIKVVRQSGNDYVPEFEAVTPDEFGTIFERPPRVTSLRPNEIVANKFRFLSSVRVGEMFYVFVRLDPYEQADLMQRQGKSVSASNNETGKTGVKGQRIGQSAARPRRVTPP